MTVAADQTKPLPALYGLLPAIVTAAVGAARAGEHDRIRRLIYPLHFADVADLLQRHSKEFTGYTELGLHNNYSRRLMMRKGSLIQDSSSKIGGVSARCYRNGAFGFAAIPDASDVAIKRVLDEAAANVALFRRKVDRGHL